MFLFKCCQEFQSGEGYEVQRQTKTDFRNSIKDITPSDLSNDKLAIRKIKKSQYEEVSGQLKKSGKKFIDHSFPAHQHSLGNIEDIQFCTWKRIPEIMGSPVLIGPKIEPHHVVQGTLQDCYFLSALAALAENESTVRGMLEGQSYNQAGIYKVVMRINGQLQEIIVDDFIPVNENSQPFFCQPYRNQFWMLILEKAWAKINGSYKKIIMGTPTQVFKALTLAPADLLIMREKNQDKERIWLQLSKYAQDGYPMVCTAREDVEKGGQIEAGHAYSLIGTAMLEDIEGTHHKVVKLRNPWSKQIWQGGFSSQNRQFWSKIVGSYDRKDFQKRPQGGQLGVFYLSYKLFCSQFQQIHYCFLCRKPSYNSQPLFVNKKNGSIYEFKVPKQDKYSFELHQSEIQQGFLEEEEQPEGPCRSTMLIIRRTSEGPEFVNGILKYSEEDAVLSEVLEPGNYLLYAKLDASRNKQLVPRKTVVSVYSPTFTQLQQIQKKQKYPELLSRTFLEHARGNKKNEYNNGLMWISWKLLLQQGGYAYVAMGVDPHSNKKFVIDFSEEQFNNMNFKLKGKHKGQGNQRIEVLPGEEEIILARVNNQLIKSMKFPPNLGIKMELIEKIGGTIPQ